MMSTPLTLSDLAAKSGLSARTVRYYISRGLLQAPNRAGRSARYDSGHLERIQEIQRLQREGLTLAEIGTRSRLVEVPALPDPEPSWSYTIADGVEVTIRGEHAPWRVKKIRRAMAEFARNLQE